MLPKFHLSALSRPIRIMLTAFLLIIGGGYLAAIGNLFNQHAMADGQSGLSLDDIRVVFSGMDGPTAAQSGGASSVARSRMLEQIEPGGKMRKFVEKGGPEAERALVGWLSRGAKETEFETKELTHENDPSARSVIERNCLRCHNAIDGERKKSPFSPDGFDAEYPMVIKFAAPGTAKGQAKPADSNRIGPQDIEHLYLVAHIHMLSMPVFTLILTLMYVLSVSPVGWRAAVAAVPMVTLLFDFSSWWLARVFEPAIYIIAASGGVFGIALAIQLITILIALWRRPGIVVRVQNPS